MGGHRSAKAQGEAVLVLGSTSESAVDLAVEKSLKRPKGAQAQRPSGLEATLPYRVGLPERGIPDSSHSSRVLTMEYACKVPFAGAQPLPRRGLGQGRAGAEDDGRRLLGRVLAPHPGLRLLSRPRSAPRLPLFRKVP